MQLLNEWRDDVLRNSDREVIVTLQVRNIAKVLQIACMQCHSNKEKFCDSCHEYAAVQPTAGTAI